MLKIVDKGDKWLGFQDIDTGREFTASHNGGMDIISVYEVFEDETPHDYVGYVHGSF